MPYVAGGLAIAVAFLFWFSIEQAKDLGEANAIAAYERGVRETTEALGTEIVNVNIKMADQAQVSAIKLERANNVIDQLRLTADQEAQDDPFDFSTRAEQFLNIWMRCFAASPDERETCRLPATAADTSGAVNTG